MIERMRGCATCEATDVVSESKDEYILEVREGVMGICLKMSESIPMGRRWRRWQRNDGSRRNDM